MRAILPVVEYSKPRVRRWERRLLDAARRSAGSKRERHGALSGNRYWRAAGGLLVCRSTRDAPALIGAFALYLSYVHAGQEFLSFQWDSLLLETGSCDFPDRRLADRRLAVPLARLPLPVPGGSGEAPLGRRDVACLDRARLSLLDAAAADAVRLVRRAAAARDPRRRNRATLAFELVVVFLIFLPRRPRALAAWCVLLFQALILVTGNYNFFNLLSMLMCVFLFDDAALRRALPASLVAWVRRRAPQPGRLATAIASIVAFVVVPVGVNGLAETLARTSLPVARVLSQVVSPLMIVNRYGLFAVMTTSRPEIVIEGSSDGQTWREYVFRYKPGR
jgi:hypothetical protein